MLNKKYFKTIILVFIGLLLVGCKTRLYGTDSEQEANRIINTLAIQGVSAEKKGSKKDGFIISVSDGQFNDAIRIIESRGLPEKKFPDINEIFPSDAIVQTPLEQQEKVKFIQAKSIEQGLSKIHGVVDEQVNLTSKDVSTNQLLDNSDKAIKASVLLIFDATKQSFIVEMVPQIKEFVSNSVAGLKFDNVNVVLIPRDVYGVHVIKGKVINVSLFDYIKNNLTYFIIGSILIFFIALCVILFIGKSFNFLNKPKAEVE